MIATVFLLLLLAYFMLLIAEALDENILRSFAGMFLMAMAVYTFQNGVDAFNNFTTFIFSAVTFGTGSYVALKGGTNLIE